jgi:hypothetical protein
MPVKRIALAVADRITGFDQVGYGMWLNHMETLPTFELRKYQLARIKLLTQYWHRPVETWDEFHKLPLTTKHDIDDIPEPPSGEYNTQSTSGSTGEPRTIYIPWATWHRKDAVFHRSWRWLGREPRDKVLRLIAGDAHYSWYDNLRNDKVINRDNTQEAADWIIKNVPYLIHGAGLPIREILERVIELGYRHLLKQIKVEWCGVSSEGHRERLEPLLAGFYEQYGLAELPTVASPCWHGNMHLVMEAGYTEVVNGEIVVTDFHNNFTPIIRYRTGDAGTILAASYCKCGRPYPLLRNVEGRRCDYYNGPEVRRSIGWWTVSPLGHDYPSLAGYRLEVYPKLGQASLFVRFKPGVSLSLINYSTWFEMQTGLNLRVIDVGGQSTSKEEKRNIVRVFT